MEWIHALLNGVATPEQQMQRELSRLVGRDQRRDDDLDAFASGQGGCVVHLAIDACLQQEAPWVAIVQGEETRY